MAGKRHFGAPRRSGPRRLSTWIDLVPAEDSLGGNVGFFTASLNAAALAFRPFTIVRTHLEIVLRSDQAAAIEVQIAAVGLAIVSDQAVAVGVTALPTPISDAASNLWFLHKYVFADESSLTDRTRGQTNLAVDLKAMRKVEQGQDMVVMLETQATGAVITTALRMLLKMN